MKKDFSEKGFYVDIGCHGPRRGSNTYWLYKRGWRGLLVDIEDTKVWSCKLARPRDTAVKIAVTKQEGNVDVYSSREFSTTATIIPSVTEERKVKVNAEPVRSTTLTRLLAEFSVPQTFELLSIDTEGSDLDVLVGLDFNRYRPIYICVEEIFDKGVLNFEGSRIHALLLGKGYQLVSAAGFSLIYKIVS